MTTPSSRVISTYQFHDALVRAGVLRADELYRRVVIDACAGQLVMIYAERFADQRLLDVAMTLDGIQVITGQPAGEQPLDRIEVREGVPGVQA